MVFAAMMIYYGWLMAALQLRTHQKTIIMQIPLVYLYAILPLMGTMMLIRAVQVIYQDVLELRIEKEPTVMLSGIIPGRFWATSDKEIN